MGKYICIFIGILLFVTGTVYAAWYIITPPEINSATPPTTATPTPHPALILSDKKIYEPPQFLDTSSVPFEIYSKAGVALDLTTNQVFWAKDAYSPHFIASLTKIMTAVIALELSRPYENFTVPYQATQVGEASMYLVEGEKYTLEELLYGLMLLSANDAAETIAIGTTGRSQLFTQYMNQKASLLKLQSTRFVNPSGLDEDLDSSEAFLPGRVYQGKTGSTSSAHDLVVLTKYALDNYPLLSEIVSSQYKILGASTSHAAKTLYNVMDLVRYYPGIAGVKSGNSNLAGLTVVELARKNGHEVLIVLLNSPSPRQEVVDLLDYSFSQISKKEIAP